MGFNKNFKDGRGGLRGGANNASGGFQSSEARSSSDDSSNSDPPIAFWDMEEGGSGTTVTDRSAAGNGLDLTLRTKNGGTAPSWNTESVRGTYSVKLEGGGQNQGFIADNDLLDFAPTDAFSVSMWVKKDNSSDGSTTTYMAKMSATSPAYRGWEIGVITGAKIKFFIVDAWTSPALGVQTSVSHMSHNSAWNHIVVTYDGSAEDNGVTIYHNGTGKTLDSASNALETIVSDTLDTDDTTVNADIFTLGSRSASQYADIYTDDVAIFDYELTAAQVTSIYNSGDSLDVSDGIPA